MSKHTPGPWRAVTRPHGTTVIGADDVSVAWCGADYGSHGATPHAANARLIAAAPDLLAACEAMLECCEGEGDVPASTVAAWRVFLRAAIAKAKGGE